MTSDPAENSIASGVSVDSSTAMPENLPDLHARFCEVERIRGRIVPVVFSTDGEGTLPPAMRRLLLGLRGDLHVKRLVQPFPDKACLSDLAQQVARDDGVEEDFRHIPFVRHQSDADSVTGGDDCRCADGFKPSRRPVRDLGSAFCHLLLPIGDLFRRDYHSMRVLLRRAVTFARGLLTGKGKAR